MGEVISEAEQRNYKNKQKNISHLKALIMARSNGYLDFCLKYSHLSSKPL